MHLQSSADPSVAATYDGADNGSTAISASCDKNGSRLGYTFYNYPGHDQAGTMAEGIIMTYAEQQFLLAEAAHNGWITDDAATHHASGVQASLEYYGADFQYDELDRFCRLHGKFGSCL